MFLRKIIICLSTFLSSYLFSQNTQNSIVDPSLLKPNPEKEAKFLPYLAVRHGGMASIEQWRKDNTVQYYKELWYFCESFYIKRNYFEKGIELYDASIDIYRFESERKENEEAIVTIAGVKDVIVLLPSNKLIYKANFEG